MMTTNLERYLFYCSKMESPELYIEFSFYSLIASCLQRRVWISRDDFELYPNLYIIFVGPPGTGKSIAARVNIKILEKFKTPNPLDKTEELDLIPTAPDTTSLEALTFRLGKRSQTFSPEKGVLKVHTSLTFISEELGNLFQQNTFNLINFFNQGYDSGDYKKELKYGGNDYIKKMCLNLLAATNPGWMAKAIQYGIIEQGLASRAIFIAGGDLRYRNTFYDPEPAQKEALAYISKYCLELTKINGQCTWTNEAELYLKNWWEKDYHKINNDKKLDHYYSRKKLHVMKLALVINFADSLTNKIIQISSVQKALDALARAEMNMHEAFASSTQNPIHNMAVNIMNLIESRGKSMSMKKINLLFHEDETHPGDISAAIEWLTSTGQLRMEASGGTEGNILVIPVGERII